MADSRCTGKWRQTPPVYTVFWLNAPITMYPPLLPRSEAFKVLPVALIVGRGGGVKLPEPHKRAKLGPHTLELSVRECTLKFHEEVGLVGVFFLRHDLHNVGSHIVRIEVGQQGRGAVPPGGNVYGGADRRRHRLRRRFAGRAPAVVCGIAPEGRVRGARFKLQGVIDGVDEFLNHTLCRGVGSSEQIENGVRDLAFVVFGQRER